MRWHEYRYTCQIEEGAFSCDLPFLVVKLIHGDRSIQITALIDSGCTTTLVRRDIADLLGINLSDAREKNTAGITGNAVGRQLEIEIEIKNQGNSFKSPAIFTPTIPVPMLLG